MFNFGKTKKLEQELAALQEEFGQLKNKEMTWNEMDRSQWADFFGAVPSSSGVVVTTETAKRSAAVYACCRLIAGAVALLPLPIYERTGDGGRRQVDHDVWWLLNESPYPTLTACSFWEWMLSSMLLRGDGLAKIIRDRSGRPAQLMPLPRECVSIVRVGDTLHYYVNDDGKYSGLEAEDVLHFPGFGFDGTKGESVIRYAARQAVGAALAADEYAGEFFSNGASPSMVITYPQGVAPDTPQQDYLRQQFDEKYVGRGNHHRPMLLVNGGDIKPVSLTAEDAQLLETRKFQVVEIARAFGAPPHMIGETSASTSWGTGIEQMSIGFVRYTLGPHLRRIEQELNRKLWPRSAQFFTEFNRDGLLAGDSKTEAEVLAKSLGGPGAQGWAVVNEVRRRKNMPPIPGGDTLYIVNADHKPAKPTEAPPDEPDPAIPE
ncbi:phage portal protein [Pseudomonas guariconensis]|uniref:phage portal protein n=1 Tax=Pseudomonas guariconensis TaxID=1288410 RepID=UPI0018AA0ECF|nr:phage portal protein [Pseudomonas guariconensis]MBF8728860.1 phage portal protein [Pseudomonas guariconensis]